MSSIKSFRRKFWNLGGQSQRMGLEGNSILYAGYGNDFALKTRAALEAIFDK